MGNLTRRFCCIAMTVAGLLLPLAAAAQGMPCGLAIKQGSAPDPGPRFQGLANYDGRAFIDMHTCLVWRLDVFNEGLPLDEAMQICATTGQGGPYGAMGWRLPTLAELTSVDGEEWNKQREEFERYKIPAMTRSEAYYWTDALAGLADKWAVVEFSGRTTVVNPVDLTTKAYVWCVRRARNGCAIE